MESSTGREAAILGYVLQTCERYGQNELVEKYYADYAAYAKWDLQIWRFENLKIKW